MVLYGINAVVLITLSRKVHLIVHNWPRIVHISTTCSSLLNLIKGSAFIKSRINKKLKQQRQSSKVNTRSNKKSSVIKVEPLFSFYTFASLIFISRTFN